MYKIIGGDGNEYGPITADQLRQWVREGRANGQTRVQADGNADWKPLSEFPEFADALLPGASAPSTPATIRPVTLASLGFDTGAREAALRAVKGPAIALIITAALGIAYYGFNAIFSFVGGGMMFQQNLPPELSPQLRTFMEGMRGPLAGVVSLGIVALNAFVLFGAIKMLRLQSYGLVFASVIVAMLPCQCCCLLGLPFGIWALMLLMKPEIKSQFS